MPFSDRMDASYQESLYEYGIIRNPETNKTIFCINRSQWFDKENKPKITVQWISKEDVIDGLREMDNRFWKWLGVDENDIEDTIDNIDNEYLSIWIFNLNVWCGWDLIVGL